MITIYIADSDSDSMMKLQQYFSVLGYSAEGFSYISDVNRAIQSFVPDILITELDFTDGDGFQFIRRLRIRYSFPIIIASERNSESDRIMSFELGCDDYVSKPYSIKELTLRSAALLRRRKKHIVSESVWYLRSSTLRINSGSHLAILDGREIRFTVSEWKVISFLAANSNNLVSRVRLLQSCFPESLESSDRIIDTHIKNIRAKFGAGGADWIETVRGYGYRFRGSTVKS